MDDDDSKEVEPTPSHQFVQEEVFKGQLAEWAEEKRI